MKLLELRLLAFGPFTGLTLDFSHAPGLHLVYGQNEAGKSTTLRAIRGLLYGIPASTADAHLHRMPELRIGARLGDGNGAVLEVVRRKGAKNTLLDSAGNAIDEALLRRLMGGVGESLFHTMFGLDHDSLRSGGEALLRGQGDVGESLFDASVGGPGIHHVLEALRREADAIFKPQAQNPFLNQAISLYRDAEKRSRGGAVSAEAWFTQREEIEAARRERDELQRQRRALTAEQARLQRALRVLPLLAKRRQVLADRDNLGDVAPLPAGATERRIAAEHEVESCRLQTSRVLDALGTLEQRRAELAVPAALADLDDATIDDLQKRLGSQRSAAADLPKRRGELLALEHEIRSLLRELGLETGVEDADGLRMPPGAPARLRALAKKQSGLEAAVEHARQALSERQVQCAAVVARRGVADLGSTPSIDAVDRFDADRQHLEREADDLRTRERDLQRRAASAAASVEEIRRLGDVPTEESLRQARSRRDQRWSDLLACLERPAKARAAAEAFAAAAREADEVADRLRREAERAGKLAHLLAARHESDEQLRALGGEREDLERRRAEGAAAWRALWAGAGVEPRAPVEMKAWLTEQHRMAQSADEMARDVAVLEQKRSRAEEQLAAWREQWASAVEAIGLAAGAAVEEAEDVIDTRTALLAKMDEAARLRSRILAMERDTESLHRDVDLLVTGHAPDLAERAWEDAAERLVRLQRDARTKLQRRAELGGEIETKRGEIDALEARQAAAADTLRILQSAAGTSTLAELAEAERRSTEAARLDRALSEIDAEILEAGDGAELGELCDLTLGLDPDSTRARLQELETRIEEVVDEISTVERNLTLSEAGLDLFLGRTVGVEAAAEVQEHAASIRAHVERYVRAKLAVCILQEEVEKYRQQNQGPILRRADELFPRLTLGSFRALKVGFDERDEGVLLCERQDGVQVGVEGLSDGTRDQLYLALRLASLERYLRHNTAMPVVLDDILIHFDDERARAALAVLGEFGRTAQVLFFTHHARLVELARESVPGVVEHRLEADDSKPTDQR